MKLFIAQRSYSTGVRPDYEFLIVEGRRQSGLYVPAKASEGAEVSG